MVIALRMDTLFPNGGSNILLAIEFRRNIEISLSKFIK